MNITIKTDEMYFEFWIDGRWIRYKHINLESNPIFLEFLRWLEQSVLDIGAGETLPVVGFNRLPSINATPRLWFKTMNPLKKCISCPSLNLHLQSSWYA